MDMDIIVAIIFIVLFVLIMRSFGAWMLRIDEVIDNQKEQSKLLKDVLETIQEKKKDTGENTESNSK